MGDDLQLEFAPVEEEWTSPKNVPIRDYSRDLAGRRVRMSLYIYYAHNDTDEYSYVIDPADESADELPGLYEFRGDRAAHYLEKHPALRDVLWEAHEKIRKYFGPDAHVLLDAIKDSEMDENERLFAFVQTDLSADDALDRLDELYEQWWLDRLSTVQPKMSIDVEFV